MGTQPPTPKEAEPTQFSAHVYCGQTAAWIKMQLGTEVGLGLRDTIRCGPNYPQKKRHIHPPNFLPMSIVAKWLDG